MNPNLISSISIVVLAVFVLIGGIIGYAKRKATRR